MTPRFGQPDFPLVGADDFGHKSSREPLEVAAASMFVGVF